MLLNQFVVVQLIKSTNGNGPDLLVPTPMTSALRLQTVAFLRYLRSQNKGEGLKNTEACKINYIR